MLIRNLIKIEKFNKMKIVFFSALALLLISCDGFQNVSGLVVDDETKKPIEKVTIKEIGDNTLIYSDKNGYFEIKHIVGGFYKIPDVSIIISKKKYLTDTISISNGDSKLIKMIRKE